MINSNITFFKISLPQIFIDIINNVTSKSMSSSQLIAEAERKRNAYWIRLISVIIVPILLYLFVWAQLIYLLPVSITMFCFTQKLPPSVPSSSGYIIQKTTLPDLPGTRVLASVKCPNCGKESDAGNVYCPYCYNSMKKRN